MFRKYHHLFQDSKIDYPIYDLNLSFADYITKCKTLIRKNRLDLKQNPNAELIVETNSPFELLPPQTVPGNKIKYGALLIHGLLDSPFVMKDIGLFLQSNGILARAILLPGHGTVPGNLLNIDYHAWLQAVKYGIATLEKDVEHIFLVGFSTGASLGLYHTLQNPKIAGLLLASPAIKIRSAIDFTTNWYRCVSWAWERAKWFRITEENDYARYESIPFNAAYQVYRLTKEITNISKTKQLNCPVFMAISEDDKTVSSRASIEYFQRHPHPKSCLILYDNRPTEFEDPRLIVRRSAYPELKIVSFSHVCIPNAVTNPHYGKEGDYIDASHVDENLRDHLQVIYGAYSKVEENMNRLLYKLKLTKHHHRRLTFNPDFDYLMHEVTRFIINI